MNPHPKSPMRFSLQLLSASLLASLMLPLLPAQAQPESPTELSQRLITQVQTQNQTQNQTRLAVLDLVPTQAGQAPALGDYLAEQLLPALIQSGQFQLLERGLVDKIIKEQGFSQSALANPDQAISLGKLSGAEWILLGRYTVLDQTVEVNLRLIRVENGQILAALSGEVPKTDTIRRLTGEPTESEQTQQLLNGALNLILDQAQKQTQPPSGQQPTHPQYGQDPFAQPIQPQPPSGPRQVFFEDFSRFAPGTPLPDLGPYLVVRTSQKYPMHVVTSEDFRSHVLRLPIQNWPQNFRLDIHAIDTKEDMFQKSTSPLELVLTDAQGQSVHVKKWQQELSIQNAIGHDAPWHYQDWNILSLVKQGQQLQVLLNGQFVTQKQVSLGQVVRAELKSFSFQPWAFTRLTLFAL